MDRDAHWHVHGAEHKHFIRRGRLDYLRNRFSTLDRLDLILVQTNIVAKQGERLAVLGMRRWKSDQREQNREEEHSRKSNSNPHCLDILFSSFHGFSKSSLVQRKQSKQHWEIEDRS
jgi:hypothetical protein